jgi:hypothetical protein
MLPASTNRYSRNIALPFSVDLLSLLPEVNPNTLAHVNVSGVERETELLSWLTARGLMITHAEAFHTPPGGALAIHVDGPALNDIVKLNWQYGGKDSLMMWYRLKDPLKPIPQLVTGIGTNYLKPQHSDCVMVHSAKIGKPTLVNVGRPHAIVNPGKERRWVVSLVLGEIGGVGHLQWDRMLELLK